jgi:hypothetical protein
MRLGFELKIPLARIGAIFVLQRMLDVHRVSVMSLDEVGVIAVHRADERSERSKQAGGKAAAEPGGFLGEIECQVGQRFPWRGFLMELVAFILALPPAWRATRISPMEAIRTV